MPTDTTVTQTRQTVSSEDKPYLMVHKVLDFILMLIEGFLLLSFIFKATGANQGAGFVQLVEGVADALMVPFRFIFPAASAGQIVVDWSMLVAMLVYALIFYVIRKAVGLAYTADRA